MDVTRASVFCFFGLLLSLSRSTAESDACGLLKVRESDGRLGTEWQCGIGACGSDWRWPTEVCGHPQGRRKNKRFETATKRAPTAQRKRAAGDHLQWGIPAHSLMPSQVKACRRLTGLSRKAQHNYKSPKRLTRWRAFDGERGSVPELLLPPLDWWIGCDCRDACACVTVVGGRSWSVGRSIRSSEKLPPKRRYQYSGGAKQKNRQETKLIAASLHVRLLVLCMRLISMRIVYTFAINKCRGLVQ